MTTYTTAQHPILLRGSDNANLIDAAPDLLAALSALADACVWMEFHGEIATQAPDGALVIAAREAIAKASAS